ncbi:FIG00966599: hypothetical protein, partial [Pseudomonas fluorescens]
DLCVGSMAGECVCVDRPDACVLGAGWAMGGGGSGAAGSGGRVCRNAAAGIQAVWLDYLAGGRCLVVDCRAGVHAGRLGYAGGAAQGVAMGNQRDCLVVVCPRDWRFQSGGVFQGSEGFTVCTAGYLGVFAVVCGAGSGVVGGGLDL